MTLRSELSENWVKYLPIVVSNYNNTPIKKLGYMTPNNISEEKDSAFVDEQKKKHGISTFNQANYETQNKNIESVLKNPKYLQVNDYCYKFFDENIFSKKYNVSVSVKVNFFLPYLCKFRISFCNNSFI